jgi:tRNA1(Val) A37 N6-methylase TrmN6
MSLDHASKIVKHQTVTRDAFLGGKLTLAQPRDGFRAGLDSVLLGAAVRTDGRTLLDLGAGVGTAALVALVHNPRLSATLVESDDEAAAMAASNLAGNGLADRGRVVHLDVTAPGRVRADAGLASDHFDTIIANPPYFDSERSSPAAAARVAARQLRSASLDSWVRTAATHLAPNGEAIFVFPAQSLHELLAAFHVRFGSISVLPLAPHDDEAATRILVRGIKGSRAPLTLLASRILHEPDGRGFRPEFEAIFRGAARLDW